MPKRAIFKIEKNGKDVTEELRTKLLSLSYHDEAESKSDRITIALDGLQHHWSYGDEVNLFLGYEGEALFACGTFTVYSSERSNLHGLQVVCTGVDFGESFKVQRSTAYEEVSIAQIVKMIAQRNNLKYQSDFDDVVFPHLSQTNESDMHFLRRLAEEYDAFYNVKGGTLLFIKRVVNGKRTSKLMSVNIEVGTSTNLAIMRNARPIYKSCRAVWIDPNTNKTEQVIAGSGEPIFNLERFFQNGAQAQLQAQAKLQRLKRDTIDGRLTMEGRAIEAGGEIVLSGTYAGEDDDAYTIKSVEHRFSDEEGWSMTVEFAY